MESMTVKDNKTLQCIQEIGETAYTIIFVYTEYANFLALGIPLAACLGSAGNLFTIYINHYRKVSGLSVAFLNALLVLDCAFLASLVFLYSPRGHLPRLFRVPDCAERDQKFWNSIDYAQRTYVITHSLLDLARLLVVWFTAAYVLEQYAAVFHQERLVNLAKAKSAPMKIIVIVFNLAVILSLIHFFKYVRKESLYDSVQHLEVCLSDVYMSQTYVNYDIYIYFGLFLVLPWFVVLLAVLRMLVELRRTAHERRTLRRLACKEMFISIDIKEARSFAGVMTVAAFFLVCYGATCGIFIYVVLKSGVRHSGILCYLVPVDWRFSVIDNGLVLEWVYTSAQIFYSVIKLPVCYATSKAFRLTVHKWCRKVFLVTSVCCGGIARVCYLGLAGRERFMEKMMKGKEEVSIISYDNRTFASNTINRGSDQIDKHRSSRSHHHHHHHHHHHRLGRKSNAINYITDYDVAPETSGEIPTADLTPNNIVPERGRPYVLVHKQLAPVVWESNV